ncbi:MAG: hypothetical protein WAL61_11530, partial [Acidimicrobiales bacterium]
MTAATDSGSAGGANGAGLSKLRLSAKTNGRLLKGYGPLAALLVAFLFMALLVPTKAPQQDVVHETQSSAGAGAATGASSTATTTPGAAGAGATGA